MNGIEDGPKMAEDASTDDPRIILRMWREWYRGWSKDG